MGFDLNFSEQGAKMTQPHLFGASDLRRAYRIAAKVVALHGDTYLPIFQRLHTEIQKIESDLQIKSIALNLSSTILLADKEAKN